MAKKIKGKEITPYEEKEIIFDWFMEEVPNDNVQIDRQKQSVTAIHQCGCRSTQNINTESIENKQRSKPKRFVDDIYIELCNNHKNKYLEFLNNLKNEQNN